VPDEPLDRFRAGDSICSGQERSTIRKPVDPG